MAEISASVSARLQCLSDIVTQPLLVYVRVRGVCECE